MDETLPWRFIATGHPTTTPRQFARAADRGVAFAGGLCHRTERGRQGAAGATARRRTRRRRDVPFDAQSAAAHARGAPYSHGAALRNPTIKKQGPDLARCRAKKKQRVRGGPRPRYLYCTQPRHTPPFLSRKSHRAPSNAQKFLAARPPQNPGPLSERTPPSARRGRRRPGTP